MIVIIGWESDRTDESALSSNTGGTATTTPTPKYGSYCWEKDNAENYQIRWDGNGVPCVASSKITDECTIGFHFRIGGESLADSDEVKIAESWNTGGSQLQLFLTQQSGNLNIRAKNAGTTIGTGTSNLSTGTWYFIEFSHQGGVSSSWSVKLDGAFELQSLGQTFSSSDLDGVLLGSDSSGIAHTFQYDNLYFDGSFNQYLGEIGVFLLDVDTAGTQDHTAWTGDDTDVDDLPTHDSGTTVINTNSNTNRESTDHDYTTPTGMDNTAIHAVQCLAWAEKDTNPDADTQVFLDRGGNRQYSVSLSFEKDSYDQSHWLCSDVQIGGVSAWTQAELENTQPGIEHNQAQSRNVNCTAIGLMVAYSPAAAGGSLPVFQRQHRVWRRP